MQNLVIDRMQLLRLLYEKYQIEPRDVVEQIDIDFSANVQRPHTVHVRGYTALPAFRLFATQEPQLIAPDPRK